MPSITTLQMLGLAGILSYAAARFATKAGVLGYNRYALVAVPVSGMPKMPRGFRVEALSPDVLASIEIDVSPEVQSGRFAQGLSCLGAFNAKNELVGVNWIGLAPFIEDEVHVRFSLPQGTAWDTGLWVRPDHRMGRAFATLWAGTAGWLSERGCFWSISRIADYKLQTIQSHNRMNAVIIGHITVMRLFRWQYMAQGFPRLVRIDHIPAEMRLPLP
ncbi:MAG: hypothetical protein ACRCY3_10335 [Sphingorhabdus sp.]